MDRNVLKAGVGYEIFKGQGIIKTYGIGTIPDNSFFLAQDHFPGGQDVAIQCALSANDNILAYFVPCPWAERALHFLPVSHIDQ